MPLTGITKTLSNVCRIQPFTNVVQSARLHDSGVITSRPRVYVDHMMKRDAKKRKACSEYSFERISLSAMVNNEILPLQLRNQAQEDLSQHPRPARLAALHKRCCVTSRAGGLVKYWKMSRFIFRNEADHNRLAGVMRAKF